MATQQRFTLIRYNMIDKSKAEKMVALKPEEWHKMVEYISNVPVPFLQADKAVEIMKIITKATWLDVVMEDEIKDE